jgi:hypothetical protein
MVGLQERMEEFASESEETMRLIIARYGRYQACAVPPLP